MENASKALIIAGAILISILIVGLGVIIYNNVADTASSGTLDAEEITAHNSPFQSYFGSNISGTNVKALFTRIQANNNAAAANGEDEGYTIKTYKGTKSGDAITPTNTAITSSEIKTGKTYTVSVTDEKQSDDTSKNDGYWKNGYIKSIVIVENN